jgi:bacteriorhodopsin
MMRFGVAAVLASQVLAEDFAQAGELVQDTELAAAPKGLKKDPFAEAGPDKFAGTDPHGHDIVRIAEQHAYDHPHQAKEWMESIRYHPNEQKKVDHYAREHPGEVEYIRSQINFERHHNNAEYNKYNKEAKAWLTHARTTYPNIHGFLDPEDKVAISFWIVSIAMIASTAFFMWEGLFIGYHWKTSMNVGALVTLIAAVHYLYMREYWVTVHASPIVYRYIDWSLTVPLQMIEFFLILQAVKPDLGGGMFFRLLVGTVIMLLFGFLGEQDVVNPWLGFCVGMAGWGFILYEIFAGEGGKIAGQAQGVPEAVKSAFGTMRFIVSVGWSIYPLGYFFGYLLGQVGDHPLNLIYNLADFVNKIWFCLAIWAAAKKETRDRVIAREGLKEPLNP